MIQLVPQMKILVAVAPVDFRKGIDGLAALCRTVLKEDPMAGTLFLFRNRAGSSVKLLVYDGNGFWLCQKRFSSGKLAWWPTDPDVRLSVDQISTLLQQRKPADWRKTDWKPLRNDEG